MTIDEAQDKIEEILRQIDQEDMKRVNASCITYIKNEKHDTLCLYGFSGSIGIMCSQILITNKLPASVALISCKFVLEYIKDKFSKEAFDTYMSADISEEIAEIKELEKKEESTEINLRKEKKETPVIIPMSPSKNPS